MSFGQMDIGHRHLILAYAATIVIHLSYLGYVLFKARTTKKLG
jgi:hypothetical protein